MVRHPEVRRAVTMAGVGGFTWFAFTLGLASLGAETSRPGLLVAKMNAWEPIEQRSDEFHHGRSQH